MAKKKFNKRIIGVDSSTLAMFEGVFASIIGLGVAVLYALQNTVEFADQTDSLLAGLAFGMASGIVSIIVLPLIYFGLGWLIGYVHGFIFNVVAENSNGIVLRIEE